MRLIKSFLFLAVLCIHYPSIKCQAVNASLQENLKKLGEGGEEFALDLFSRISSQLSKESKSYNFMISPFSIWSLIVLLAEGSAGNTLEQIRRTLRIETDMQGLREGYMQIQKALNVKTSTVDVSVLQAVFSDKNKPIYDEYRNTIEAIYKSNIVPMDFTKTEEAKITINDYVSKATNGLINSIVNEKDLQQVYMILISAIFFKGQWKIPFNTTLTREETFYDETGKILNKVNMMTSTINLPYAAMTSVDAHVLELPYGKEDRLSMLVFLPKLGTPLATVIEKISKVGLKSIYTKLINTFEDLGEEEVEIILPRFTITSDLTLNVILEQMGIIDLFDQTKANLTKMSNQALFLSRIFHKTKIEVNEEGTVAAAVTAAMISNKSTPQKFYVNRPFAFIIFEKTTNSILFCGEVRTISKF